MVDAVMKLFGISCEKYLGVVWNRGEAKGIDLWEK